MTLYEYSSDILSIRLLLFVLLPFLGAIYLIKWLKGDISLNKARIWPLRFVSFWIMIITGAFLIAIFINTIKQSIHT